MFFSPENFRFIFAFSLFLFGLLFVSAGFTKLMGFGIVPYAKALAAQSARIGQKALSDDVARIAQAATQLSESVNNPIRLFLGWFAVISDRVPPLSLAISYWMVGAFFMAMKRYAELRHIGDAKVAAAYRRSFAHYTEERLLVSLFFYATICALFAGIFMVRYHIELILFTPFAAGVFAFYLHIGMRPNSPVQHPEKLYRQRGFFAYMLLTTAVFVLLMFTSIPALYDLFNVESSSMQPLWTLGAPRVP